MKKAVCLVMSVLILACSVPAFAKKDGVLFTVGTDIHVENTVTELEVNYPESELYFQASGSGNLYDQAAALTKDFLYESAREGAEFILMPGDFTRGGTEEQHRYVAKLLSDFEDDTGIQVYVVPGNHDYYNSTRSEFREYYYRLGYDAALAEHDATSSYTADVADGYRLIAVDSNDPGEDGDAVDTPLLGWIKTQAETARKDGKKIIFMMHHPLLEHLYLGKVLMKDFIVQNSEIIANLFTSWGIEYVFSGHEHGNDISSFTGSNGKKVYDILTTSLSSYPLEYRAVRMNSEGADITMRELTQCNMSSLIPGYSTAQKQALAADYEEYAYGYFKYAIERKILRIVSPSSMKRSLKAESGPLSGAVDSLFSAVCDALTMPLYDTGEGTVSVESLARSKGVSIPASGYGSLIELASAMVAAHYYGDENMPSDEYPEAEIFIKGLNTGLEYVLSRTGRDGLNLLLGAIALTLPDTDELSPLFRSVILGKEDSYIVAEKVLMPFVDRFTTDSGEADRDVFLPCA